MEKQFAKFTRIWRNWKKPLLHNFFKNILAVKSADS